MEEKEPLGNYILSFNFAPIKFNDIPVIITALKVNKIVLPSLVYSISLVQVLK